MTLTITLDDRYQTAFNRRATKDEPAELIASRIVAEKLDGYLVIDEADQIAAITSNASLVNLAQDPRFTALCVAAASASPEKQDAALDAAEKALNS